MTDRKAAQIRRKVDAQAQPIALALLVWLHQHPERDHTVRGRSGRFKGER